MERFEVHARLPKALAPLERIARNLWFAWHPEAVTLFQRIDRGLWSSTSHNPLLLLSRVEPERLAELAKDEGFVAEMERVEGELALYLKRKPAFTFGLADPFEARVGYFSPEFGLAESVPVYSGGLGILAGDHLKSASDLAIPLVGVGLLYHEGYFRQYLNADGFQQEDYPRADFFHLPIEEVRDAKGQPLRVEVPLANRTVQVAAHRLMVGRVPLYLLDTNLEENPPDLREITAKLYGGDREMRIRQEIVLGVGGVRVLTAIGEKPDVLHMNEGHSAFAALERMREAMEAGLSLAAARHYVRATTVFTTHTPVPAGNEIFGNDLAERYLRPLAEGLGADVQEILGWGRFDPKDRNEPLGMTVLSLRVSAWAGGVARLHGNVSRRMWSRLFPGVPEEDVPIGHVTNGIHVPSWISPEMTALYDRYLGPGWSEDPDNEKVWEGVLEIPETEFWRTHERRRERLIAFVRRRLAESLIARGASRGEILAARNVLDPEALTICFARRFATYKRATLLFRDKERLAKILCDPARPVQVIFAGKAHPQDEAGKEFIRQIAKITREAPFAGRVVFLENYDMNVARYLLQGCDVWLNNPRRPLEASGTSGMKAAANGALNLSTLDGWWDEAYNQENGWGIGAGEEYDDEEAQDAIEARALLEVLERECVPLFYKRGPDGLPGEWIERARKSLRTLVPYFNSHRMLEEYVVKFYQPAADFGARLAKKNLAGAKELASWAESVEAAFGRARGGVSIGSFRILSAAAPSGLEAGAAARAEAEVHLGGLAPDDVAVEVLYGPLDANDRFLERRVARLASEGGEKFAGDIPLVRAGRYGARVRVRPEHGLLATPLGLGRSVHSD